MRNNLVALRTALYRIEQDIIELCDAYGKFHPEIEGRVIELHVFNDGCGRQITHVSSSGYFHYVDVDRHIDDAKYVIREAMPSTLHHIAKELEKLLP